MPVSQARHQHRHYKTLIALVCCMTVGAFVLYGIDRAAPGAKLRPLRSIASPSRAVPWDRVAIRMAHAEAPTGFYHFRIDAEGRLFQSGAWRGARHEAGNEGAIQVLLTRQELGPSLTAHQKVALTRVVDQLCREQRIPRDRVVVGDGRAAPERFAESGPSRLPDSVRGI